MVGPWSNFGEGWQTNKIMPLAPRVRGPDLTPPRPKRSGSRQFLQGIASYPSKQKKPRRLGRGLVIGGLRKIETHEPALPTLHQDLTSKFPITKRCDGAWLGDQHARAATDTIGHGSSRWHSIRRFLALSRHRLTVRNHLSARIECASLARGGRCARTRSTGIRRRVDHSHRAHRCGRSRAAPGNAGRAGVRSSSQAQSDPGRSVACFRLFRFRRKRPAACL